jgi:pimeloyl-[acyl-carrier protein] methyl ester esterase
VRLIVLPGLDGTGTFTDAVCTELAGAYRIEAVRFPADIADYDALFDWLQPRLPREEYAIVAESFSGPLALRIAAGKPENMRAIILVASFARAPRRIPASFARLLTIFPVRSIILLWLVQWALVGRWVPRDFAKHMSEALRAVPKRTLSRRLQQVLLADRVEDVRSLTLPRLFVRAARDALVPKREADPFLAARWQVVTIEGPHFLNLTRPKDVSAAIRVFLAGHLQAVDA